MYEILFDSMQFPVAPEKLQMKTKNQNVTMNLISGQEINLPADPGLTEFSFSVLLPAVKYPFAVYPDGFRDPSYYLGKLEELKVEGKPVRFKVNRHLPGRQYSFDNDIQVLLEDYTVTEEAGEGFDVKVDINIKKYVEYGASHGYVTEIKGEDGKTMKVISEEKGRPTKEPVKSYTIKKGDTLWGICKKELGDGAKCQEVARLNNIANASLIYPGQVIRFA